MLFQYSTIYYGIYWNNHIIQNHLFNLINYQFITSFKTIVYILYLHGNLWNNHIFIIRCHNVFLCLLYLVCVQRTSLVDYHTTKKKCMSMKIYFKFPYRFSCVWKPQNGIWNPLPWKFNINTFIYRSPCSLNGMWK